MMEPKILSSLITCILCILKISSENELTTNTPKLTTSTPRSERDICRLQKVTTGIIVDLIKFNYTNETTCTNLCRSNETCAGVSWRQNSESDVGECRLKLFATGNEVKYWSLLNSDDHSLSYCWKLKTNVHRPGGVEHHNVKNETKCQQICIDNCNCIGVDWTEKPTRIDGVQCWVLLTNASKGTKGYTGDIKHWTIVRTVPINCYGNDSNIPNVEDFSAERSTTKAPDLNMPILLSLGALLGVWTLIIIGISIYALTLKKSCSTQKVVVEANVYNVDKVDENKVNAVDEAKEEDDESYIDYQDLRRLDNAHTTYEEACEYTAMEVENMKDDDDVYCNEDQ